MKTVKYSRFLECMKIRGGKLLHTILDMQMSKVPIVSGYVKQYFSM
jgi:ABC-type sulfate transport system permease subunit